MTSSLGPMMARAKYGLEPVLLVGGGQLQHQIGGSNERVLMPTMTAR